MVSLVAVAMMTLQQITVVLQQKVCEYKERDGAIERAERQWAIEMRAATIKRRATFTKLFMSHDTRSAT